MKERKATRATKTEASQCEKENGGCVDVVGVGAHMHFGAAMQQEGQQLHRLRNNPHLTAPLRFRDTFALPRRTFCGILLLYGEMVGAWRGQPDCGSPFAASPPLRLELVITFRLWCCQLHHLY
jgi:hypothetical protein